MWLLPSVRILIDCNSIQVLCIRYDEQFNNVMRDNISEWRLCNFFEHATCVAPLRNTDDLSQFNKNCLPSCDLTSIHQDGIHVSFFI